MATDRMKVKAMHEMIAEAGKLAGVPQATVGSVLKAFRDVQLRALADGQIVRFYDVGNLRLMDKPARIARNPRTGEKFQAPAGFRCKFDTGSGVAAVIQHKVGQGPYPDSLLKSDAPESQTAKVEKPSEKDKPPKGTKVPDKAKSAEAELKDLLG